jgi:hypothetical protein
MHKYASESFKGGISLQIDTQHHLSRSQMFEINGKVKTTHLSRKLFHFIRRDREKWKMEMDLSH